MVAVVNTKPTVLTGLVVGNVDANGNSPVLSTGANPLMNDGKASACLEVQSSVGALLVPRMTTLDKTTLNDCDGMIVFDTDLHQFSGRNSTRAGFGTWTSGLGDVQLSRTVIPAADVLLLNVIDFRLLPVPTVGKFYNVLNVSVSVNVIGAAFGSAGVPVLKLSHDVVGGDDVPEGVTFTDVALSLVSTTKSASASLNTPQPIADVSGAIVLENTGAAFNAGGTSTLTVNIWYTVSNP